MSSLDPAFDFAAANAELLAKASLSAPHRPLGSKNLTDELFGKWDFENPRVPWDLGLVDHLTHPRVFHPNRGVERNQKRLRLNQRLTALFDGVLGRGPGESNVLNCLTGLLDFF